MRVDKAYLQGGWKQAGLGECGFTAGNFLLGNQDDPKDASLKALLVAPDTLLVVEFGRPETFNPVRGVSPEQATCALKDGQLSRVLGPPLKAEPDVAVLRMQ